MLTNNFKLKEGQAPFLRSLFDFVSNKNLTDALAIALLKENPANKNFFEKLPANLEEMLASHDEAETDNSFAQGVKDSIDASSAAAPLSDEMIHEAVGPETPPKVKKSPRKNK